MVVATRSIAMPFSTTVLLLPHPSDSSSLISDPNSHMLTVREAASRGKSTSTPA